MTLLSEKGLLAVPDKIYKHIFAIIKMKKRLEKKGVSPVIATVLLIALVIIIAVIIFLWFRGMTKEAITKYGGTNVELVCDEVSFDADYDGTNKKIYISNTGNIPIYDMKVKIYRERSYETKSIANWPETGINQGGGFEGGFDAGEANKIVLIPVLLGESERGKRAHTCEEDFHGVEVEVD